MMNETEKLLNRIKELEDENLALKHQLDDLKKELELCGKVVDTNEPITLTSYYGKKYLEIHEEVYKKRIEKLIERENKLKDEYNQLLNQEESSQLIIENNETINNQLVELDNKIQNKYYELEKLRFEFSSAVKKVTNDESKITQDTLDILSRITSLLFSAATPETIINEIGYTMSILENSLYPINLDIAKRKLELVYALDELNDATQRITMEIKSYEVSQKELKSELKEINSSSIEALMESITAELEKINKSKNELKQLFDMLKDQNLKKVQDEIKHLQILEYSNKEIAQAMDDTVNQYYDELMNEDTVSNIELKKIVELSKLSNELIELEGIQNEFDRISSEYEHLNSLLATVNNNISQMEEYVKMTSKAILSKPEYNETVNRYEGYLTTINLLKQEIENAKIKINELKEERRLKSLDPYAKATIQKLTEQIKATESMLAKYNLDLENTTKEVEAIAASERNLKLMSVLKDKKLVEAKLPLLYNQQKELVTAVTIKHDELKKLEESVRNYENILERIEELKSEINH